MRKGLTINRMFTILICIMPILHQYASIIRNVTLGEIFFIILIPLTIITYLKKKTKIFIASPYLVFIFIMTIANLVSALIQKEFGYGDVIVLFIRLYLYYVIIVIMGKLYFDFKFGVKVYKYIGKLVSMYLIIQTIAFYAFHKVLPTVFTWIPLYNNSTYHLINFDQVYSKLFRPQSIFLEPGTYAQYILPCLALALFGSKFGEIKSNLKESIFFTISLVLSLSAQGFIIAIFLWIIWIIKSFKDFNWNKRVILIISCLASIIVSIFLIFNVDFIYQGTIGRFIGDGGYDSTGVRVIRGFQVFEQLDPVYKFIGIGFGNVSNFVISHSITTPNDLYAMGENGRIYNFEYMNGIAYILVTGGIISLIAFIIFIGKLLRGTEGFSRMCVVILILFSIVAGVIISPTWVIMMTYIYREYEDNLIKEKN